MKKYAQFLLPAFIFSWIILTVAVDFIAIPTVFRTLKDPNLGGAIGINLFPKVNWVEIILAVSLCSAIFFSVNIKQRILDRLALIVGIFLFLLTVLYLAYLSPEIKRLTLEIANNKGNLTLLPTLNIEHQFFHHLYIKLESVKLFLLFGLMAWSLNLRRLNQI